MLPKLQACQDALRGGVGRVRILPSAALAAKPSLSLEHHDSGTEVTIS
jgi:hypothetical protein